MDADLLKILSEELRETKNLVMETRRMADAAWEEAKQSQRQSVAAEKKADAVEKKADAAWELVIMTRNQIQEELKYLKLPWWKKLVGANG